MIRILSDRHDGHRIESDDGVAIGSIRNQAIRLTGFDSDCEALDLVLPLWTALDGMLATHHGVLISAATALVHALDLHRAAPPAMNSVA